MSKPTPDWWVPRGFPLTSFPKELPLKPTRLKFGIDPTSDRLHLGHLVPLRLCRKLQDDGEMALDLVLGTLTGRLGDPSGQDKTRPVLSMEEALANANKLQEQALRVLNPGRTTVHFNHFFVEDMDVPEFIVRLVSQFSVAGMLARDGFRQRMDADRPISLHELLVPLLQGWDSVVLNTELEVGGTDQLFNFQAARTLQKAEGQAPQHCFLTPVINGTDGRKMSKSLGNCIWLDDTPEDVFGKTMSIPDTELPRWTALLTDLGKKVPVHPMKWKAAVARSITTQLHGEEAARQAQEHFQRTVQQREVPAEIPNLTARDLLAAVQEIRGGSKTKARKLVKAGAIRVNGEQVFDVDHVLQPGDTLKAGKRDFGLVPG